jgi:hypothetical protein
VLTAPARASWPDEPFAPSQQPGAVVAADGYRLSGPYTHENMSVFLVHGPETLEGKTFFTLQDGLELKRAVVHETSSVGTLTIENLSHDEELFIQSGDIVKGGKQDRTLLSDSIVGPRSGQVPRQYPAAPVPRPEKVNARGPTTPRWARKRKERQRQERRPARRR